MSPPSHSSSPKIMVFRPTLEEMKDFPAYIAHMESMGAHKAGIAKIIPPKEFVAAYDYDDIESKTIPAPIQQEVMGHQGLYTQYNIQKKPLSYQEFKKLANSSRYATPSHFDYDDLERKYWKNITYNPPIYGADISGSLYSKGCNIWNVNKLNTLLDVIEEEQGVKIEGVNTAYLYFGMWKTTFAWHTEDMDLYSINYLHFGAPKSWYGIPPEHAKRLERLAAGFFPQSFQICPNFLRHKMTLISPQILKKYSIPYDKITQETGEFMITFPYGYHAGYNHGFNCAESTNFASLRWIDFGKRAKCCSCQKDSVKINMDPFIRIFQPHRYETWKAGEDVVYIEDLDKPSSGIQSQNMLQHQSPKSMANEVALKTRRQPLHKRDGRRTKAGTTSHGKHSFKDDKDSTKKAQTFQEISPTVSIPVFKLNIESVETTSKHFEVNDGYSSLSQTLQGDALSGKEEPAIKVTCLDDLSHKITEISTSKSKKKKSKSTKRDSKLKKKHSHSNGDVSSTLRNDTEAKKRHTKSKKKHSKTKKGCTKPNQKEGNLKDSEKRPSHCQEENERRDHLDVHECSGSLSNETKLKFGEEKEISTKSGLLLEKERSDKKRKSKAKKTGLLKLKAVKCEPANSNSSRTKSSSSSKDKNKGKRKTLKLDTLFGKSKRAKLTDIPREMRVNSLDDASQTGKDVNMETDELIKGNVAAGKLARPTLGQAGVTDKTAQTRKTKHDFTSQEFSAMKAWARSMNGLWVTQPHSYDMELAYNLSIADQRPGCCVCMLFYNEKIDGKDWDKKSSCWTSVNSEAALSSHRETFVLTPEICFAATSENRFPDCLNDSLTDEGHSLLLNCSQCKITVHASCYGVSVISPELWKCKRCEEQDYLAECCLCNLRGGALKHTTSGRWAHIVCAMAIPEVLFEDVKARDSINIENISPARLKLKCFFCRPFIKMGNKYGGLIQCSVGRCALAFHVTCAQAAGVVMEPCDWPFAVYATCLRHPYPDKMKDKPRDSPLKNVSVSDAVIAKHKNGRYYRSEIIGEHQQVFLHVKFDDGSYSENLYPQDIESHDCMNDGLPDEGAAVQVRWTDGLVYKGTFVSSYMVKLFDIEFEDRSVSRVKREDIYSHEEPLPKKVRTKLSTASDMRHENFLESKVVTDRHRHVCSLYASNLEASNDMMTSHNAAEMLCFNNTHSATTEGSSEILCKPQEDQHTSPHDIQGLNTILIGRSVPSEDDQQQTAPTTIIHELKEELRLESEVSVAENNSTE